MDNSQVPSQNETNSFDHDEVESQNKKDGHFETKTPVSPTAEQKEEERNQPKNINIGINILTGCELILDVLSLCWIIVSSFRINSARDSTPIFAFIYKSIGIAFSSIIDSPLLHVLIDCFVVVFLLSIIRLLFLSSLKAVVYDDENVKGIFQKTDKYICIIKNIVSLVFVFLFLYNTVKYKQDYINLKSQNTVPELIHKIISKHAPTNSKVEVLNTQLFPIKDEEDEHEQMQPHVYLAISRVQIQGKTLLGKDKQEVFRFMWKVESDEDAVSVSPYTNYNELEAIKLLFFW